MRDNTGTEIKQKVPDFPEFRFNIIAINPEIEHISHKMENIAMEKHRGEYGENMELPGHESELGDELGIIPADPREININDGIDSNQTIGYIRNLFARFIITNRDNHKRK